MNRLNLVTLGVRDIVKSINFYKNGLGFDVKIYGDPEDPDVVFFNNNGSRISLYPIDLLAKDIYKQNPPSLENIAFSGVTLAYNAKSKQEVDEIFILAKNAEATIVKLPEKVEWGGYSGYFQDPDGHLWEVAYGAMWQFDEQDMLIIN